METKEARELVLSAFNPDNYYFSQVLPFGYTNWIDGMAWVGLLCGASYKVGDTELAEKCELYLNRLMHVGPDARNFAPMPVTEEWIKSTKIEGIWFKQKPQSFAGPAGLRFAIDNGAHLNDPFQIKGSARRMVFCGWAFGYLVRWIHWLRQHINSMFLAHLILDKRPASSMMWMCEENQFFSYIARKKCSVEYPPLNRTSSGHTVETDEIVPLAECKPSSWIFRRWPKSRYLREGTPQSSRYTPWWQVVGDYLQSTL
jgi:hypothetical protein